MGEGLDLDLSGQSTQEEEATQGPAQGNLFNIGGTEWSFLDGDTLRSSTTDQRVRLRGIDTRETAKFLKDSGFQEGELGGDAATAYIWSLANKHGFNRVVTSGEKGVHGRDIGDLVNKDGHSFVDTLLRTGVVSPSRFSTGEDVSTALMGGVAEAMRVDDSFLSDDKKPLNPFEEARKAIYAAETDQYGGLPVQKFMAFNAAEFAANPDLFMGMKLRLNNADYEGKSRTPFGTGFDNGLLSLYKGLNTFGQKISSKFGAEEAEASFAADAAANQLAMGMNPTVKMDVSEIDWGSFDEVTDGLKGMLGTSIPFMGMSMVGMAAAPFTYGTSMSLPIAMYTGMTLDSMEGDIADKNLGVAITAGTAMAYLDKLGIKGLISPSMMITKEGRQEAIKAIAKKDFSHLGYEAAQAAASKRLLEVSKKGLLSYIDDAAKFSASQMQKGVLFREGVKSLVKGSGGEGVTEALQELTEYTAAVIGSEKEWDYDEIEGNMLNAIAAGGLMGAGFTAPGVAIQVGDWKVASDFYSKDDGRFDKDLHSNVRSEVEDENGFIPSVDDIINDNHNKFNDESQMDLFDAPDDKHIDDLAEEHKTPNTSFEYIQAFVKNPMVALRGAFDNTVRKAEGKSKTLVMIADMLGSTRNRVFGGVNFITWKQNRIAEYGGLLRDQESIEASFNTPRGLSSAGRSDHVSTLMNKFYKELLEPATKAGKDIDWSKASEDVKNNKDAILQLDSELNTLADTMLSDNNRARSISNESKIKRLSNWAYRHKSFRKEFIASHRTEFISTIMSSYKMSEAEAAGVADAIINDETVSTLGDAFDITKGGVSPSMQKKRTMHISDRPEFNKFLEQNMFKNMADATRESSRFQAHRRFIGKDSKFINQMLSDVRKDLLKTMDPESAEKLLRELAYDIRNLLNAESGNYKRIENQTLKQAQKYLTLLTALQGLANAALSSLAEMGMVFSGVPREVLVKNAASQGYLFGSGVGSWIRNLAVTARVAKPREELETILDKKLAELRAKGDSDPRHILYTNMKEFLKTAGFTSQETGAATTTGVQETNELTKGIADSFFKANFLHDQQDMHRMMRLSLFNDFLIDKLDLIEGNWGKPDTVGVAEAKHMLRELGIPLSIILPLAYKLKKGIELTPAEATRYKREFLNGGTNFVNQAVPMPNAFNRPLFYSDPHFALLTQFNGFTSTFTANQLPLLWDQIKGKGSVGITYGAFATMGTMLALAFMSQGIKDELKYGGTTPYLTDNQRIQRAIYSSGLLGTTERVIGSNFLFPLYGERTDGAVDFAWDNVAGEAAATGTIERGYGMLASAISGEDEKFMKNFYGSLPFVAPYKHRLLNIEWD